MYAPLFILPVEIAADEVPEFLALWHLLEPRAAWYPFPLQRFNLALGRERIEDRVVDLVIAAESLFLLDTASYQGELRFRVSLRAAKFIEHPNYNQQEIYDLMKVAYDIRSGLVHTGNVPNARLPRDGRTTLAKFTDVLEDVVRRALRKALSIDDGKRSLSRPAYWDQLVLSAPSSPRE